MRLYASQDLALIFEQVFVTPDILAQHNALQVKLRVEILQSDYEECRDHLEQQMRCESIESDSAISSYTTQSSDVSGSTFVCCIVETLMSIYKVICGIMLKIYPQTQYGSQDFVSFPATATRRINFGFTSDLTQLHMGLITRFQFWNGFDPQCQVWLNFY